MHALFRLRGVGVLRDWLVIVLVLLCLCGLLTHMSGGRTVLLWSRQQGLLRAVQLQGVCCCIYFVTSTSALAASAMLGWGS
jgi:hypothetical protein